MGYHYLVKHRRRQNPQESGTLLLLPQGTNPTMDTHTHTHTHTAIRRKLKRKGRERKEDKTEWEKGRERGPKIEISSRDTTINKRTRTELFNLENNDTLVLGTSVLEGVTPLDVCVWHELRDIWHNDLLVICRSLRLLYTSPLLTRSRSESEIHITPLNSEP